MSEYIVMFNLTDTGIKEIKESLYEMGAQYASMSGSGSAVFGIFETEIQYVLPECSINTKVYSQFL